MMKVDWSQYTPAEVFQALAEAPKVAGPWRDAVVQNGHVRRPPERVNPQGATVVWELTPGRITVHAWVVEPCRDDGCSGHALDFTTREEADAKLRDLGWLLVDDAQAPSLTASVVRTITLGPEDAAVVVRADGRRTVYIPKAEVEGYLSEAASVAGVLALALADDTLMQDLARRFFAEVSSEVCPTDAQRH